MIPACTLDSLRLRDSKTTGGCIKSIHQLDSQSPLHIISLVIHEDELNAVIWRCGQNTSNIHKNTIRYPKQSGCKKKRRSCTCFDRWVSVYVKWRVIKTKTNIQMYVHEIRRKWPRTSANFFFSLLTWDMFFTRSTEVYLLNVRAYFGLLITPFILLYVLSEVQNELKCGITTILTRLFVN